MAHSFTIESTSSFPIILPSDIRNTPDLQPGEIILTTLQDVKPISIVNLLMLMCEGFVLVPSSMGTLPQLQKVLPNVKNGDEDKAFPDPEPCDMVWSLDDNAVRYYDGAIWISFTDSTVLPAGNMQEKRASHTSTLLKDGRILLAGGTDQPTRNDALADCEIWNPITQKTSAVASMTDKRFDHSATLLPDGKVLVTGGVSTLAPFTLVTSTEVYDPETDSWATVTANPVPRAYAAVGLLQTGDVIVAGGNDSVGIPLVSTYTYDPLTDIWTAEIDMLSPQASDPNPGVTLDDGTFVVVGGWNLHPEAVGWVAPLNVTPDVQSFDPVSGLWSYVAPMSFARCFHSVILLPQTGRVASYGGVVDGTDVHTAKLEIYHPDEDFWADLGVMSEARSGMEPALLGDAQAMLAFGGFNGDVVGELDDVQAVDVGDQATGTFASGAKYQPNRGRKWFAATRYASGQVLISGGVFQNNVKKQTFIYGNGQV